MTLKITPSDLERLREAIQDLDTPQLRQAYLRGEFPRSELCKDVDQRYRWDLLHFSRLKVGDGVGIKGDLDLYAYLDDSHIDSALRHLVPPLASSSTAV